MKSTLYLCLLVFCIVGCATDTTRCQAPPQSASETEASARFEPKHKTLKPVKLLDGNMDRWASINFGGEGDVAFKDGALELDYGNPLTGVKYTGDVAELFGDDLENYIITFQAQRVEGVDMFAAVTFPVGKDGHVSLVVGGWAGAITGLSNLDGLNASENKTTQYHAFEDKQWYTFTIVVTDKKIICKMDDKLLVDVNRADYTAYDTHGAVIQTKPFGLFNYGTWGLMRNLTVTKLD
ncbi:MAG: family 16 glycoside hydrolase [Phycisphaeraceae bacterium]